jgi:hypothetical protein
MMTQVQAIGLDEQAIALESGAKYFLQSMTTNFLPNADDQSTPVLSQTDSPTAPNREPLKHLLIGSAKGVTSTIHRLQVNGYAYVGDWSPLLPTGNPGEVMSILDRPIVVR